MVEKIAGEKKKAWRSKLVQTQLDRKSCKHTNTFAIPMLHFLCFNTHIHTHRGISAKKFLTSIY